jgi:hypothetical protein
VTADKVSSILDDLFHQVVPEQLLIGQLRNKGQEPWADVPFLDEIPYFSLQKRIIMGACGIIDPFSLGSILPTGATGAFLRTIRSFTFSEVCELVSESGLRAAQGEAFPPGKNGKQLSGPHRIRNTWFAMRRKVIRGPSWTAT